MTNNICRCLRLFFWGVVVSPVLVSAQTTPAADQVRYLDQGWSKQERIQYYFTSQGSAVLPYEIYLNLEEAAGEALFRNDRNSEAFGFIVEPADDRFNPDGLPVGLTKTVVQEGKWKGDWLGISCAACHSAELYYRGTKLRIDGGVNNHLDFLAYLAALDDSVTKTVESPEKFERLAQRLKQVSEAGKANLYARLQESGTEIQNYRSTIAAAPHPYGPGRMDALTLIHNRVMAGALRKPENWVAALVPAKPPFLWNAPQSAWVQWTGVASDPLSRNAGESLGVFIRVDLTSKTPEEGLFSSTMDLNGQTIIEELLRKLAPPTWPEDLLGKIDREKAAAGKRLFAENCSECHSVWPHRWSEPKLQGKRFIENALVPQQVVGTDASQFNTPQFDPRPSYLTGRMAEFLPTKYKEAFLAPEQVIMKVIQDRTIEKAINKLGWSKEQEENARGFRDPREPRPEQPVYKAGPRDGIWAVPPYLHNGSVPSLYDLLTPAKDRPKEFLIGREFDPVKVGVDTTGNSGKFLFDTALIGNSNAGHSFENTPGGKGVIGRRLTEEERWALIEYLKSIPTEPGQVTPYGGPANPVQAWKDPTFFHQKYKTKYDGRSSPIPANSQ